MSAAPNQLVEIYRQLQERFSSSQAISISSMKGDPPDRYEITYNIKGLSKPAGEVVETTGHVVEIAIPFGFPHFPPSCKPKSDIFHPDFDPAAICLGDFWLQDRQLPDLIVFIGRMLNGELYSKDNAFNEEACIWYQVHHEKFPLAEVAWEAETLASAKFEETDDTTIDTLEESDLSTSFDLLFLQELSDKEGLSADPPGLQAETPIAYDLDLLHLLDKQKRYYTLREHLKDEETAGLPPELRALFKKAEEMIGKSQELFRESRSFEKKGDLAGAVRALEKITRYTDDFPDHEAHTARLLQDSCQEEDESAEAAFPGYDPAEESAAAIPAQKKEKQPPEKKRKPAVPTLHLTRKLAISLCAGAVMLFFSVGGYFYWLALQKIDAADAALGECRTLFEKNRFEEAKKACEEANSRGKDVRIVQQDRVRQLKKATDEILLSQKMVQGLKGMVLVEGRYLTKKDAEAVKSFQQLRKKAEDSYSEGNWQSAIECLEQLLAMPITSAIISNEDIAELQTKQSLARFRRVFDSGMLAVQTGKWQEAVGELSKAETLLPLLPEADSQQYAVDLKASLTKATFEQFRGQGDLFFASSEWKKAIAAYQQAVSLPEMHNTSRDALSLVQQNMKRAELYDLIDQGIQAFGTGALDKAIGDFRRAEDFLADHQAHLNMTDAEKNIKKLSRIILQAMIVRDKKTATGFLEKNDLKTAMKLYRQLVNYIDKSPFAGDSEFAAAKLEIAATIQDLDEKIFIAEKSAYLESVYKNLFTAQYPTTVVENLVNPTILFTKEVGDKAVFKMQCTETGGGRPLTLVMYYAYDRKRNQWEAYSETQ